MNGAVRLRKEDGCAKSFWKEGVLNSSENLRVCCMAGIHETVVDKLIVGEIAANLQKQVTVVVVHYRPPQNLLA